MARTGNILTTCQDLVKISTQLRQSGKTIGLVPTMGALHEGHLSLVRQSLAQTDETIVSLFLNPKQFAPTEDLASYPVSFEKDMQKLAEVGDVHVFAPAVDEMYPAGFSTSVSPPAIAKPLEGEYRATHFSSVATVVLKLFNLAQADVAFFGQKDFQQCQVIRAMVRDLNVPIQIQVCPIVRDDDGLALSSRNAYLTDEQRAVALSIQQTLEYGERLVREGLRDGFELIGELRQQLIDGGVTSIDYATIADPDTLDTLDEIRFPAVLLIAAYVGTTRLIDNRLIDLAEE